MSQTNLLLPLYSTELDSIDSTASKHILEPLLYGLQAGSSIFIALSSLGDSLLVINPGLAVTIALSLYSTFNRYNSYKEEELRYQLTKTNYLNLSSTEIENVLTRLLRPFGLRTPPQLDQSTSIDFIMSLTYPARTKKMTQEIMVTGLAAFLGLIIPLLPYFFATPLVGSTISGFLALSLVILIHYIETVHIMKLSSDTIVLRKIMMSLLSSICITGLCYFILNGVILAYSAKLQ
ncbi:hypothetical protein K501DRAFT_61461 [Backusella circina FSU 941]|nr:hypothetical protein K501DRAFT_61461 [Backusella circina FSU 941]